MSLTWTKVVLKSGFKIAKRHIFAILLASLTTTIAISALYFFISSESSFKAKRIMLSRTPILLSFSSEASKQKILSIIDKYKLTPQTVEMEGAVWLELKIEALKLIPNPALNSSRKEICEELERIDEVIYVDCATDFIEHKIKTLGSLFNSVKAVSYAIVFLGFLLVTTILKLSLEKEKIFDALELCGASRTQRWIIFFPSLIIIGVISFCLWLGLITPASNLANSLFELDQPNATVFLSLLTLKQAIVWFIFILLFLIIASIFLKTRRELPLLMALLIGLPSTVSADVIEFLESQLNVVETQLKTLEKDLTTFEASFSNQRSLIDQLAQFSEVIHKELTEVYLKLSFINALVKATPYRLETETERLKRFVLVSQKLNLEKRLEQLKAERDAIEQRILETELTVLQPIRIEKALLDQLSTLQKQQKLLESALEKVALQPNKSWSANELGITIESCKGFLPWPVKGSIIKGFAPHKIPPNLGITIASEPCEEVRSLYWGKVKFAGPLATTQTVILEHELGYFTIYSGLEDIYVENGEVVQPYSPIGRLSCEQPHLKFELQKGKQAVNPIEWLAIKSFSKP